MNGLKLAVCLLAGLLATVAIAWSKTSRHPIYTLGISLRPVSQPESPNWLKMMGPPLRQTTGVSVYPGASATITDFRLPTNADEQMLIVSEFSFGFPLRAMTYVLLEVPEQVSPNPPTAKAIAEAIEPVLRAAGGRVPVQLDAVTGNKNFKSAWFIPVYPVWSGLVIDSVLYGFFFAAVGHAWSRTRGGLLRHSRRHRGVCEGCGYDMRGLEVCPECKRGRYEAFSPDSRSSPA